MGAALSSSSHLRNKACAGHKEKGAAAHKRLGRQGCTKQGLLRAQGAHCIRAHGACTSHHQKSPEMLRGRL